MCRHQAILDLSALEDKELGYLLGIYVGDGSLIRHRIRGEFLLKIALDRTRDSDILDFVRLVLQKGGKRVTLTPWRSVAFLRIWSKSLYNFIRTHVMVQPNESSNRHTKFLLDTEKWNRKFAIGFLGGLIDSDGHIVRNGTGGHYGAYVTTSSTSLRDQLHRVCSNFGLTTTLHIDERGAPTIRPRHSIYITSSSMRRICSEILSVKHQRFHGGPGRT